MKTETYWVYMRQADRRIYPCVVWRDEKGMTFVGVAHTCQACSVVTAQEAEILKTFRGAKHLRLKRVKPGPTPQGKWDELTHPRVSYSMHRDPPMPVYHIFSRKLREAEAYLKAMEESQQAPLYHPHTASGFK